MLVGHQHIVLALLLLKASAAPLNPLVTDIFKEAAALGAEVTRRRPQSSI